MWILKYNWQNVMLEQRLKKKNHSAIKLKIVLCNAVHSVYIISWTGHSTTSTFTLFLQFKQLMSMGFTGNCHTTLWDTGDSPPAV